MDTQGTQETVLDWGPHSPTMKGKGFNAAFVKLLWSLIIRQHQMHETQTIVIDDPVVWASVSVSVTWATVLTHSPDGTT